MGDQMSKAEGRNGQPPLQSRVGMPRKKQEDSSFGPRLADLRKARGLTQVQLAAAAGTTQRAISYYENDTGFPPASALIDLARALKVSTDEMLGLKPPKVERIDSDPEARRMWKRFRQFSGLPERDQRAVIRLISSLVSASAHQRRARAS